MNHIEAMKAALKRAFQLGQNYWSWADSEYSSHWKKADAAKAEFDKLVEDTLRTAIEQAEKQEPVAWVERWYGSGPDRGWWVWEAGLTHGNAVAYIGESDLAEKLASLIVEKHNATLHATPPAAPVQEPPDDGFTQALIERDEYHAIADELAEMIARITGEDIGEHTSANFPWRNALDAAENWLCHPPAAQPAPVQELVCVCGAVWSGQELVETPAAQRQWVGLTPDDRRIVIDQWRWDEGKPDYLCRLIEAKLKEKNT